MNGREKTLHNKEILSKLSKEEIITTLKEKGYKDTSLYYNLYGIDCLRKIYKLSKEDIAEHHKKEHYNKPIYNILNNIPNLEEYSKNHLVYEIKDYFNLDIDNNTLKRYLDKLNISYKSNAVETLKNTKLKKYGDTNYNNKDKHKNTCIEKYGYDSYSKTNIFKSKVKDIWNNKSKEEIDSYTTKNKSTKKERYDNENYNNRNKCMNTKLERYGNANYSNTSKAYDTCIKRYGCWSSQDKDIRNKQLLKGSKSKLEKKVEEFLKNNNFNYISQYYIKDKDSNNIHTFDYAILNNNNELQMLIDCDGIYYHGYVSDENGKSVNTYIDDYRSQLVPNNVKFIIILENDIENGFKEIMNLINIDYDTYINDIYKWCRQYTFPYPNITNIEDSYNSLCKADVNKFSMNARYGDRVIYAFHKSIYKANRKGYISPYDAWQDDNLLLKCIKNRIIYKGNKLDPSKVLNGFNVCKIAPKVSIFNPYLAKYLVSKYLNEYNEIFDSFAGYSGRMLGTCSLGKKYIGYDINEITCKEANQIISYLNLNAIYKTFLDKYNYQCLITCPPYNDLEQWEGTKLENKSCDEWIDYCLDRYKCNKYLFVVNNTIKYKDKIVETLLNKSHFNTNEEYVILI